MGEEVGRRAELCGWRRDSGDRVRWAELGLGVGGRVWVCVGRCQLGATLETPVSPTQRPPNPSPPSPWERWSTCDCLPTLQPSPNLAPRLDPSQPKLPPPVSAIHTHRKLTFTPANIFVSQQGSRIWGGLKSRQMRMALAVSRPGMACGEGRQGTGVGKGRCVCRGQVGKPALGDRA